jgi:anaerobic selenocysteine-containing dehydrogenase
LSIHALNALKGNIDLPGGVLAEEPVPFKPLPEINKVAAAERGGNVPRIDAGTDTTLGLLTGSLQRVAENMISAKPYPVRVAFFYDSNPLFSTGLEAQFGRALESVPLVITFSKFLDETAEHADLILPDHLFLEKWQDSIAPSLSGTPALAIAQPVIEPLYDTMHTGDFLLKLGSAIGGDVAEALAWTDFRELLKFSVEGIYEAERGAVFTQPSDEAYVREMQQRGWATNEFSSYDEFWEQLVARGGWTGLYHSYGRWGKVLNTPSHKYEFYSQRLKAELEARAESHAKSVDSILEDLNVEARGDRAFLPHFEPVKSRVQDNAYPFFLNPFSSIALASATGANLPWIQETAGDHVGVQWDSWAEVNPATAAELGIKDGEWIWIESQRGRLKTKAKLYPGAMPNVVSIPSGLGHKALGRWAKDRGGNPNSIIDLDHDGLSGVTAQFSTRVNVYKA